MNANSIELPGVGTAWRVEAQRKEKTVRKPAPRRHWPRLRLVDGQLVICVER